VPKQNSDLPLDGYTIQLMVAVSKRTLEQVIQTQIDGGFEYQDFYQIEKQLRGQRMYVLLKGHYANRQLARQSIDTLAPRFKGKTWVRPMSEIRAESLSKGQ
jgi:septal ring-binding cell division protein DamX